LRWRSFAAQRQRFDPGHGELEWPGLVVRNQTGGKSERLRENLEPKYRGLFFLIDWSNISG